MKDCIGFKLNARLTAHHATRSGLGIALLPTHLAEGDENLNPLHFHQIADAQLAVDGKIEKGQITMIPGPIV
ncbi:hypothetical protein [Roseovarius litoreus]|uniref:hypothetical protein n=1 Tax=Roseovarius litoreus TaxID=1155722 RepID=UPI00165F1272|nr:hypothetical protein [Roseovarius litoreus]